MFSEEFPSGFPAAACSCTAYIDNTVKERSQNTPSFPIYRLRVFLQQRQRTSNEKQNAVSYQAFHMSSVSLDTDASLTPAVPSEPTALGVTFPPSPTSVEPKAIEWTVGKVFATLGIFVLAGLAEIGGGWLVWQGIRNGKPWYYILAGSAVLVCYGFIPTLQPEGATFSRVYAVYGGVFIIMSYGWGWALDGDRPDIGDWVGTGIALAGVAAAWFWPRSG